MRTFTEKLRPDNVQFQGPEPGKGEALSGISEFCPAALFSPAQYRKVMGTGRQKKCTRVFPWGPGMTQPDSVFKISQPHPGPGSTPLPVSFLFPFFGQNLAEGAALASFFTLRVLPAQIP